MLIEFRGRNFGCFREEFVLSLVAGDIDPQSDRGVATVEIEGDDEPLRLLRTIAIYGANAAGKSTVLRAVAALGYLIAETSRLNSDDRLRPYEPFALSPHPPQAVMIGATAAVDGRVYDYEIQFDGVKIEREQLDQVLADGRRRTLLLRVADSVSGEWSDDDAFSLIKSQFRPNALLLSLADVHAPALARGVASGLRRLLTQRRASSNPFVRPDAQSARLAHTDPSFRAWLRDQLVAADLGIVDVDSEEI